MANQYTDIPELKFHLEHPLMKEIVALKERNFQDKDCFEYAPQNHSDAMDNYERILELAGDICSNIIAPNAESVDHEGPRVEIGRASCRERV